MELTGPNRPIGSRITTMHGNHPQISARFTKHTTPNQNRTLMNFHQGGLEDLAATYSPVP